MLRDTLLCTMLVLTAAPLLEAQAARRATGPWLQYALPEEAGFSSERLAAVRQRADSVRSGAVMAVYRGHVLAAFGDVARELELHSVRKSLVSALYGIAIGEGRIDPDATLADLGIDDIESLTGPEKRARIRDLLASRSGVYHPAAYAPSDQDDERPERGTHPPGTHFFYNNWDFNLAGVIFERLTGEDLFHAFAERIARPLEMEDFQPEDGFDVYEPGLSRHPAQTFRMSTRDLARFGQLYIQRGRWDGVQVIPEAWVEESTRPHSDFGDGAGYGYMWWTYDAGSLSADRYPHLSRHALYLGRGTGGQAVFVVPGAELVVVHRGDTDHGREVAGPPVWAMVEGILAARVGKPADHPRLRPLAPEPLASQLPPLPPREVLGLTEEERSEYIGEYEMAPDAIARVYAWEGRLFMFVPGEGEAELLRVGPDRFTIHVVGGVSVEFERAPEGGIDAVVLTLGPRTMRGRRLP